MRIFIIDVFGVVKGPDFIDTIRNTADTAKL